MTVDPADESLTVPVPDAEVAGTAEGNPFGLIMAGVVAPLDAAVVIASPADETVVVKMGIERITDRIEDIDIEDLPDEEDDPPLIPDGGRSLEEIKRAIDDGKFVENDLIAENYRHIAEQGTADETIIVLDPEAKRTDDSEVVWLEMGNSGAGCERRGPGTSFSFLPLARKHITFP